MSFEAIQSSSYPGYLSGVSKPSSPAQPPEKSPYLPTRSIAVVTSKGCFGATFSPGDTIEILINQIIEKANLPKDRKYTIIHQHDRLEKSYIIPLEGFGNPGCIFLQGT